MSVLVRKARRDLARQRWQYLSVGATVFLGLLLFAASYDAFLNLEASYARTYERLAFADATVTGGDPAEVADRLAAIDGIETVTTRRQADVGIRIGADHTLRGRLVELPADGRPEINDVDVLAGERPPDGAGVLVERHMSDHFGLHPGDVVEVAGAGGWQSIGIAATVASPEYIWPARSRQDLLTSRDDFGVLFAPTPTFELLASDPVGQTLVRFSPDASSDEVVAAIRAAAAAVGALDVQTRDEQPSNAALQEDVSGFGELSFMFPALFLGAAGMATFIMLARVVRSQQAQVASLRANGMDGRRIVLHYLGEGIAITSVAGALGVVAGVATGRLVTGLYTDAVTVPDTVTRFHAGTVITGLSLAALTGALAAAAPAIAAGRTPPAGALRGIAPAGPGRRSPLERLVPPLRRLPTRWRMVLRGIGRDRRRTLSTAIGVILSLVLVLASWGMVDTVDILVDRQFNDIQRQDAQVWTDPDHLDDVKATLAATEGVATVERVVQAPAVVINGDRWYATELLGFAPDTVMHRFGDGGLPAEGVLAGRSLQSLLDVDVGDQVTIAAPGGATISTPVAGFVDEPLGTFVYATATTAESVATNGMGSLMVTFTDDADPDALRATIAALPGVTAYADARALYDTAQELLSLFYAFVGVMLAFGGLMAFALIFNTATVNTAERSPELAAMKVNGASSGQLARLLAGENLVLTVLSIVPGLAVGYWVSAQFMASFSSDLFDFDLRMRGRTLVLSALAVLAVAIVAQWPAGRTIAKLDVARVVRERSQ